MTALYTASDVVRCTKLGGVAHVVMEDRASRNTFSAQLVSGLIGVFARLNDDREVRAVVLSGYDNYFCCGGTQEELLKIFDGEKVFTDGHVFDLLLRCEVPVIAAMQGHALGGGLVMGSFADTVVLGTQCLYSVNFMKYGFTPGFGATCIIPRRFGEWLGREMLFSAKAYYGAELRDRGLGALIVDKQEVTSRALKLAEELASKPRESLVMLKSHLNRKIVEELPSYIDSELGMHQATVANPEIRNRIMQLYGK